MREVLLSSGPSSRPLFYLAICVLDFYCQRGERAKTAKQKGARWGFLASNTSLVYNGVSSVDIQNLQLNNYLECFRPRNGKIVNLIKQLFKIVFIAYIAMTCFYLIFNVISYYFIHFEYSEYSQKLQICIQTLYLTVSSFCILLRN